MAVHGGRGRGWGGRHSDEWIIQVLEADALNVASTGRAVAAGAEVWRGSLPGGAEATGGGHQAACRGARRLHPESGFYHRGAGPAGERTSTRVIMSGRILRKWSSYLGTLVSD